MRPDFTGTKHKSLVTEYAVLAASYDRRWSRYVQGSVYETLNRMKVQKEDRVLDVGCGTGALLEHLTGLTHHLTGLDPVPEMLSQARSKLPGYVSLRLGWADAMPFPDHEFDAVVACNMFHYVTSPPNALQEMRRVLRPNGHLVITDWCHDYTACKVLDVYLRLFNRAHVRTYRMSDLVELLSQNGFDRTTADRYRLNWFWGMMTVTGSAR